MYMQCCRLVHKVKLCKLVSCLAGINVLMGFLLQQAGYTGKVKIGMDVAASEFYTADKKYDFGLQDQG